MGSSRGLTFGISRGNTFSYLPDPTLFMPKLISDLTKDLSNAFMRLKGDVDLLTGDCHVKFEKKIRTLDIVICKHYREEQAQ